LELHALEVEKPEKSPKMVPGTRFFSLYCSAKKSEFFLHFFPVPGTEKTTKMGDFPVFWGILWCLAPLGKMFKKP